MENWFLDTHFKTKAVPDIHMKNLRQPSVDSCFLFRIILIEVLYMQQTNIKKKLKNNQTYAMIATENLFIYFSNQKGGNPCVSTFHSISVKKL